jgi:hypothetical protein
MMWLGRVDFRILETQDDGTQLFQRDELVCERCCQRLSGVSALNSDAQLPDALAGSTT